MKGLYIHVPFCLSKCPYCDFYSVSYNKHVAELYAEAVIRNIRHYSEKYDTVYFGGGTPVLLWRYIGDILGAASITDGAEITVEANPCMLTDEVLSALKKSGVNRLSVGVQSLCDNELSALGRRHTADDAKKAILRSYNAGFVNISADLMLGIPHQTMQSMAYTIDSLMSLPLTHISSYLLKIEENTPFGRDNVQPADDEMCEKMYIYVSDRLAEKGYSHYEISNYAIDGFESSHNLKYWNCEEYIGIGCSAHSYYNGKRFYSADNVQSFIDNEQQKILITDEKIDCAEEYVMLGLRLKSGISVSTLKRFGIDKDVISRLPLIPKEYINYDSEIICLTEKGFLLSNQIIGKLLGY